MTARGEATRRVGEERLRELATLGALRAAQALGQFAGARVDEGPARARDALKAPPFEIGVLFDVTGALTGRLGLFLDGSTRRSLVRLLLDEEEPEAPVEMVASALCELANIVASQTVSAIADTLGAGIGLSVPRLVLESAGAAFVAKAGARHAAGNELALGSELSAPDAELHLLLLFVLDV